MRSTPATIVWTAAIATSALGAAVLFSAEAGINWPMWVAAASLSVIIARYATAGRIESPLLVLLGWATLLSLGFAFTGKDLRFFIVLSDAMLLGLAVITIGAPSWSELSAKLLAAVPILAPMRAIGAAGYEVANAPRSTSSPRTRSIIKGTLLSAPLVIILFALLGSADPIIRWSTDRVVGWLPDWSFPPRILFFLFLLVLTLGANSISSRQLAASLPELPSLKLPSIIGVTEQRMVLWSAAAVLWLFVLLQASYLVHSPPSAVGSGVTFADFARRGFGELSFAATLIGAIILILEYTRPASATEPDRASLRHLELALIVALELVLVSAFRRVILYEQAYGFTTARVFAQAYMIVMALCLIALALEISRERISIAFGRRVAEIALGVFTILVFWNFEAWIVNENIDRARTTGKFDAVYASRLSSDALPTLVARRGEIPLPVQDTLDTMFACKQQPGARRWFEWNRSVNAAAEALRSWRRPPCPGKTPPPAAPDTALSPLPPGSQR